jgi:hypothetical protein
MCAPWLMGILVAAPLQSLNPFPFHLRWLLIAYPADRRLGDEAQRVSAACAEGAAKCKGVSPAGYSCILTPLNAHTKAGMRNAPLLPRMPQACQHERGASFTGKLYAA